MVWTITFSVYLGSLNPLGVTRRKCWHRKAGREKTQDGFGSFQYASFSSLALSTSLSLSLCCSTPFLFSKNTCHENQRSIPPEPADALLYYTLRPTLPFKCPCKLRAVQARCIVRRYTCSYEHLRRTNHHDSSRLPWGWLMALVRWWKQGEGSGKLSGCRQMMRGFLLTLDSMHRNSVRLNYTAQ